MTQSNKNKLLRWNLKISLDFWALKPYTEVLTYGIDGHAYKPVSTRWLCFAITKVYETDMLVHGEIHSNGVSGNEKGRR